MAKNAADSLRREVPQAKVNAQPLIFWRLDVLGGWGISYHLWGHPEFGFIVGILPLSGCLLVWGMCLQCLPDLCLLSP